jgi:hypothetical protein
LNTKRLYDSVGANGAVVFGNAIWRPAGGKANTWEKGIARL